MSLFLSVGAMAQKWTFEGIDIASNADEMLYTNAPCTNAQWGDEFTTWDVLFDNNAATFFHTEYGQNGKSEDGLDHYIRVDLGAGNEISAFKFDYTTRGGDAGYDFPQKFIIAGSNEVNGTYTEIGRIESGCPVGTTKSYSSDVFTSETPYRYLRFMVTETNTNRKSEGVEHNYWHMGEFRLYKATPDYAYNTGNINRGDRGLTSFTITDGENNLTVNSIQTSAQAPVYVDKSAEKLITKQGATLKFTDFNYNGSWMHAYAYIDYNKDYKFTLESNNNGEGKGEIVSYNYYGGKDITGATASKSDAMSNEYNGSKAMPAFTLPTDLEPGEYRMRIKVDWENLDADYGASDIAANGGCQCDITIVIGRTVTYNYKDGERLVASVDYVVEEGSEFPDLPSGTSLPYGVTVNGTKPSGTVTGDSQHDIAVTIDLPFEFAATYGAIGDSWYYLSIGDAGKLLYHKDGADHIALDRTEVDKDNRDAYLWAFVGNPFDGYKLLNRAKRDGFILSSSTNTFDGSTGANTHPIMTAEPVGDGNNTYWVPTSSEHRGGTDAFYLAQKDVNYGKNKMNNRGDILAYWNGGADAGSTFKVRHMNTEVFNWNATTEWISVDTAECSSSLMWDGRFSEGIKYIETAVDVDFPVDATVTFVYSGGGCRLNMTGVEVVDSKGNIVSGDYHFGYTGGSHDKNVYSVKAFEAGSYIVRCYATEGDWSDKDGNHTDLFANSNGRITVELVRNDVSAFAHKVTFAAEYATLYLGYDAAIPSGVEAYVVGSTENGYAIMTEVEKVIPAATPVILKKVGVDSEYTFIYENTDAYVGNNLLKGSIANRYVTGDAYVLSIGTKGIGLYGAILNKLDDSAFLNNANKAYLPMPANAGGIKSLSFRFGEGTTGIEEVKGENGEVKAIFDLTGRRVEAITAPGIYIVNGKKVLVK